MNIDKKFNTKKQQKSTWIRQEADALVFGVSTFSLSSALAWLGAITIAIYFLSIVLLQQTGFGEWQSIFYFMVILFLGVAIVCFFLMVFGKVEVTIDNSTGKIFTGIGQYGFIQDFAIKKVSKIKKCGYITSRSTMTYILIEEGERCIHFGNTLDLGKLDYLFATTTKILYEKTRNKNFLKEDLSEYFK